MSEKIQHSVIAAITNKERNLFFVQQKDESYWIKNYRFHYCFFGGGKNPEETKEDALKRELHEELQEEFAREIIKNANKIFDISFKNVLSQKCRICFFEAILSNERLKEFSKLPIKEGKRGLLIKKDDLKKLPFMEDIKKVLKKYYFSNKL